MPLFLFLKTIPSLMFTCGAESLRSILLIFSRGDVLFPHGKVVGRGHFYKLLYRDFEVNIEQIAVRSE